jgi:hypothetical protein
MYLAVGITNGPLQIQVMLSWPASATNYTVVTASDLSPTNLWEALPESPVVVNSQNVLTNTSFDVVRFYQLRP